MTQHLAELRFRIIRALLAVVIGALVILTFYDPVLRFLTQPYRDLCVARPDFHCNGTLYGLGPLDGISARMRIASYGGLIVALPVILWQIWRFTAPALHKREKQYATGFIISSVGLFSLGAYIAYWTLDKALEFLISWSGTDVSQSYQITKYVSLVTLMVLAFGVGFLFPVLLVFMQLVNVITPQLLLKQWRWAVMAIFLTAAIITPSGDPISMLALAIPMTILYAIAVGIGFFIHWRRKKASNE
ncbi:MAG: twin-arginine translocase subunit TatC [Actinomycetes bacterium]